MNHTRGSVWKNTKGKRKILPKTRKGPLRRKGDTNDVNSLYRSRVKSHQKLRETEGGLERKTLRNGKLPQRRRTKGVRELSLYKKINLRRAWTFKKWCRA